MASWGSFEFGQLRQLAGRLDRALAQREVERFLTNVLNEVGNRLRDMTVRATPVDTGQLRRGWQLGRVQKKGAVYEITVFNNVEYAPFVENGHRIVVRGVTVGYKEGVYMLRISANRLERAFPQLLQQRADELLLRIFGG